MKILQRRLVRVAAAAVAVVGWGAILVAPKGASASLVTFSYQGTVNSVDSPLASQFSIGDPITTMFTFEQTTSDTNADPAVGIYPAITSFSVNIDGYIASGTAGSISVINGLAADAFNVTLAGTVVGALVNGNSPLCSYC